MITMNTPKKIFLYALMFFGVWGNLHAQTKYRIGLQISPNIGYMPLEDMTSSNTLNVGFGLTFARYFDERYSVQTGIDALALGSTIQSGDDNISISASYIQIPLTLKMKTINFDRWTLFARIGGGIGVKYIETVELSDPELSNLGENDPVVDPFLLYFMGSIGAEYDLGIESSLVLSLDFNRSLLNQLNPWHFDMLLNQQPRLTWFTFNVGIIF